MSAKNWQNKVLNDPRGAWTRLDLVKAQANRAFICQNMRFPPGKVGPRDGYSNRIAVAAKVTSIYNWITSTLQSVIFMEGNTVYLYIISLATKFPLFSVTGGRAAVVAEGNARAFVAVFNTASLGQTEARVVQGAGFPGDKAFSAPISVISIAATDTGSGTITAGTHKFGFVMQSRTGFVGKPSPVIGSVFTPASLNSAGGKKVHLAATANTPSDASAAYPIMTRADNPNKWYFVPSGINGGDPVGIPPSVAGFSFSFDLDVTDEDLADRATSADDNFDLATQDASGNGPFSPSYVKAYGHRMVYIADKDIWISAVDDDQHVTAALHKIQVPGVRQIITALVIRGVLYLIGPKWTYSTADRGGDPKTWAAPQLVSGAIGTVAPLGVTDRTAGDYGWVAATPGLFQFGGTYSDKPITYLSAEWKRINWTAGYAVQVVDDFVNQRIYVAAPLDTETEPTRMFVIYYARGLTPYDVDVSIDTFNPAVFPGGYSAIAMAQEPDNKPVLWIGPAAAGNIMKQIPDQHNDAGVSIALMYETGRILDEGESTQSSRSSRVQLGAKGHGTLNTTLFSQDRLKSVAAPNVFLSPAPDKDEDLQYDLSDVDNFSIRFQMDSLDEWFELSRIKPYWRSQWTNR